MAGALEMAEQVTTGATIRKCPGTTHMVKNTMSSSLDADSLLRVISRTVDNTLDSLAEVYAFKKGKVKFLWARAPGHDTKEDSLESCQSAELAAYPTEILLLIAGNCDKNALCSLCLTARRFVQPARQHLYRAVDLSTHTRGVVRNTPECGSVMVRSDSLQCRNFPPAILQKQEAFIRTLDVHPEYKLYVRRLRWTILPFDHTFAGWYSQDGVWRFMGTSWQVLGSLTNLESLDLFDLSQPDPATATPRRDYAPVLRMPRLRRVILGGCIHPMVGRPLLLYQDLAKLTHLYLNNVFMQRPLYDFLDEIVMKRLEGSMIIADSYYNDRPDGQATIHWETYAIHAPKLLGFYEKLVRNRTYLSPLTECCSLKVLTFETHGNKCMGEYGGPLTVYLNALGYMVCGMILESSSQTLTQFNFRHGTDNSPSHTPLDPALAILVNQHISWRDHLFRTYIYSTICRNQWPSMDLVVLTGIDSWGKRGLPHTPPHITPIPVPGSHVLDTYSKMGEHEGMLESRIKTAIGPRSRLACVSKSRFFDPFEMPTVEPDSDSEDEGEEEEDEEDEEGEEDEEEDGAEDEEGGETDGDADADADAEEHEQDHDSDSVEEIGQAEFEQSQKEASAEEELFDQFCTMPS